MDFPSILMNAFWAGLFSAGLAVLLTAPPRYIFAALVCGLAGSGAKGILMEWGLGISQATVIASLIVVLAAALFTRRHEVSPVVLICGVLPLGASIAMFNTIFLLLLIPQATEDALNQYAVELTGSVGKAFTISLAIVLGLGAGTAIVRLIRRDKPATA
jgi:uncharacterized membrane protein YjjB (DUF3815 family)